MFSSLVDAATEIAAPVIAGIVELATSIVGKLPTLIPKLLDAAARYCWGVRPSVRQIFAAGGALR